MILEVLIKRVDPLTDLMGSIWFDLGNTHCSAIYYDIDKYAYSHFCVGKTSTIDLWLLDSTPIVSTERVKGISISSSTVVHGRINHYFNTHEFRADCGVIDLDISSENEINISVDTFFTAKGTLQAFFPGVAGLTKEDVWFTYE